MNYSLLDGNISFIVLMTSKISNWFTMFITLSFNLNLSNIWTWWSASHKILYPLLLIHFSISLMNSLSSSEHLTFSAEFSISWFAISLFLIDSFTCFIFFLWSFFYFLYGFFSVSWKKIQKIKGNKPVLNASHIDYFLKMSCFYKKNESKPSCETVKMWAYTKNVCFFKFKYL